MLRRILSCFPLEKCELWKLKAIILMFLRVVFFFSDAIYISCAISLLLGTRQVCEVGFSPLSPYLEYMHTFEL